MNTYRYNYNGCGFAYPNAIYANSIREAKQQWKKEHKRKRLPNNFQIWREK